ncbi:hypothetical protein ACTFIR_006953 [Dictyostelium discoideum]
MVSSFENFNKLSDKEISEIVIENLSDNNTIVYAFDGSTFKLNSKNEIDMENIDQCSTAITPNVSINKLLYDLSSNYLSNFIQYLHGLSELLENEQLVKIYKETNIRVIFYGDFKLLLKIGNAQELLTKFELIMEQTKNNTNHTILLGTNIEEPSETIINNIISFYNLNANVKPTSIDLIKQYYGVMVDQVSLYLGSHKFTTQGRPILICDKGNEDLYYSIGSHEYLSKNGFRKVLFDKLFCRKVANAKEYQLKIHDIKMMKQFYLNNCENVMGVGNVNPNGNYWYPNPQVILPSVDGAN